MPKLRQLSGNELISIFNQFGFVVEARRGSHVKLRRLRDGARQTLTIPVHPRIDTGTLRAIFRQALGYIPEAELHPHFYSH
ncbi:MAG: type II toxin-antitoxin system HicA family toxin [Candidatus Binataceae bacterium]